MKEARLIRDLVIPAGTLFRIAKTMVLDYPVPAALGHGKVGSGARHEIGVLDIALTLEQLERDDRFTVIEVDEPSTN